MPIVIGKRQNLSQPLLQKRRRTIDTRDLLGVVLMSQQKRGDSPGVDVDSRFGNQVRRASQAFKYEVSIKIFFRTDNRPRLQ